MEVAHLSAELKPPDHLRRNNTNFHMCVSYAQLCMRFSMMLSSVVKKSAF